LLVGHQDFATGGVDVEEPEGDGVFVQNHRDGANVGSEGIQMRLDTPIVQG